MLSKSLTNYSNRVHYMVKRCEWADSSDIMREYHDYEWGLPQYDDQILFEFLILEGMQAGLSWITILKKRENFRRAFDKFDYKIISKYNEDKIEELLQNSGIIRNRLKIQSVITNAQLFLKIRNEYDSFSKYIWSFVNGTPINNMHKSLDSIPSNTELSDRISKDLKKYGFMKRIKKLFDSKKSR